ncbi:hypothetical protein PYV61_16825, partial [Roseisolibacter sp. H3M3-2]
MTAPAQTSAAPGGAYVPPAPAPAQLAPLLAWLVERAGIDAELLAAVAQAAPDAVAPGAADPARLADALAALHQPFHALA